MEQPLITMTEKELSRYEIMKKLMAGWGLWRVNRRKQPKNMRFWRERKDNYGEMRQFDGSYHYWLEDRLGELCLLLSADDATGKITYAKFDQDEGVKAVFGFWTEYFNKNGLLVSVYLDKFSAYKINHKSAVDNHEMKTQFERAMKRAGVKTITAHSPEAKGRAERIFKTLQDRLVKEMRLANVSTLEAANEFLSAYLPKFNAQFSVAPKSKADLRQRLNEPARKKLPQIFSVHSQRLVNNDYTIMFHNLCFQLTREQPVTVYKKDAVIIEERLNGDLKINLKGYYLNYVVLPERPKKIIDLKLPAIAKRKQSSWRPPLDHPWRKPLLV